LTKAGRAIGTLCLLGGTIGAYAQSAPEKLIVEGHWKRARAIVEARIREAPDDPLANFLFSQVRNAFGDRESPLPAAETAVALDGREAKYHRQLAEVLGVTAQHANVFQQALLARRFRKEIDTALVLDPRDTQAWRDLMEFYLLAPGIIGGDESKAEATAQRLSAIDPMEGFLAQARLAAYHQRTERAEEALLKAVGAQPASYRARIALAQFYLSPLRQSPENAERQAREALNLDRGRVEAYAVLAEIYADREKWGELDSILATAPKEVPDDFTPYYRAADRLLTSGKDLTRAEFYLRTYLGQEPEGNEPPLAEGHWKLGLVLEKEARKIEAANEWREALRLDPHSPAARELKRSL
jgi:tetratricopeptide (TPR) repeat protein